MFTRVALKGGPIEPREIVDAYINANRALFNNKKDLKKDIEAAELLNIGEPNLRSSLDRISNIEANSIRQGVFRPYTISQEVARAFADNAQNIGQVNPLYEALPAINQIVNTLSRLSLDLPELPPIENPLLPIMQDTPITPTALNLPNIDTNLVSQQVSGSNYNNLTTAQKIDLLFNS